MQQRITNLEDEIDNKSELIEQKDLFTQEI